MHRCTAMSRIAIGVLCLTATASASLQTEIERELKGAVLGRASIAVSVRDATSGVSLAAFQPDLPLIPASNMKLVTTGAALHLFGPEFRFETKLLRQGNRLIVVGDGDPAFGDPDLLREMVLNGTTGIDDETFIDLWVRAVVETGLTSVEELVVDDRIFDREFVHAGWPVDQLNRRYCAQVSGFNFHKNVLHFFPRPVEDRRPDLSDYRPKARWIIINNRASSRQGVHDNSDVWIARKPGSNELTFFGNVKVTYRTPVPVTIDDPPAFFARLFAERLEQAGIAVERYRVANAEDDRPEGEIVGPVITTPLRTIVSRCNTDSENLYAECLLKRLGAEGTDQGGSWVNGRSMVRQIVNQRLRDPSLFVSVVISDGSGLSRANRISAATMTAWLNTFQRDDRLRDDFVASLPIAAENGTLRKRFRGQELHGAVVRAKSGYINGVSCLSGYVTAPDGRRRSFSILINDLNTQMISSAKKLQERIVAHIAEDLMTSAITLGSGSR